MALSARGEVILKRLKCVLELDETLDEIRFFLDCGTVVFFRKGKAKIIDECEVYGTGCIGDRNFEFVCVPIDSIATMAIGTRYDS